MHKFLSGPVFRTVTACLFVVFCAPTYSHKPLSASPVPYLAMHADDPVQWHLWNKDTMDKARSENKLLFLSVGYFACHWCHVMQRESFKNERIAKRLNQMAIPVKIDRELEPALDAALIDFVEKTYGRAGWPLNVFLTPDGYPLVGFVYLPPQSFEQVLDSLAAQWKKDQAGLTKTAKQAAAGLRAARTELKTVVIDADMAKRLATELIEQSLLNADELGGGFGDGAKFPMTPLLQSLVCLQERLPQPRLEQFLRTTLQQIAKWGMHDHVEGGFFRYTVDPAWLTPHFEKMLYDNAQLARLYAVAGQVFKDPVYTETATQTLTFLQNQFSHSKGGYIASMSAVDDRGREGGYYLVRSDDLKPYLSDSYIESANVLWRLQNPAFQWGALPIPLISTESRLTEQLKVSGQELQLRQSQIFAALQQIRKTRKLPRDDKRIAGWNALLLLALYQTAEITGDSKLLQTGNDLQRYLLSTHWDGTRLYKMRIDGKTYGETSFEDYAYFTKALVMAPPGNVDPKLTAAMLRKSWGAFFHADGWQQADGLLLDWIAREPSISDGPLPSPSAALLQATLYWAQAQGDQALMQQTRIALGLGYEQLSENPFWHSTHIKALYDVFFPPSAYCRL